MANESGRIKVPSGTKQNLETVFDDLQSYAAENLERRILKIFDTFGPVVSVNAGIVTGTDLQLSKGSGLNITVAAGEALLTDGTLIRLDSGGAETLTSVSAATEYVITLKYAEAGETPITAQNAFLYDTTGATLYSTKYTRYTDSYSIEHTEVADFAAIATHIASNPDEVPVGIVKTNVGGDGFETVFTFDTKAAVSGVVEARHIYSLKINPEVIDDADIVFTDRDSDIDGDVTVNALTADSASITGALAAGSISSASVHGTALTGNTATVSGLGNFGSLQVGGVSVQLDEGTPTVPANLRI